MKMVGFVLAEALTMTDFVHLHVHSQYSLLDGAASLERLVEEAAATGQRAVALTDHGVMYGVFKFYQAAKAAGVKPVIGCEVYVAKRSRHDREAKVDDDPYHLVLLAENEKGYKNLTKLVSLAHLDGFYYRPRVDRELLAEYADGLIALSACFSGEIPTHLLAGDYAAAEKAAAWYREVFGPRNFFLELQNQGLEGQRKLNRDLANLAQTLGLELVATNDLHYIKREDAMVHDVLLCIQTGKTLTDPNRLKFPTNEFYFKTGEEMARAFPEFPQALKNTVVIAERCNFHFEVGKYHLPDYRIPSGFADKDAYLAHLCRENLPRRYPRVTPEVEERLAYELEVIKKTGFAGYFLIVGDFVRYAKEQGIPVGPGRGSGAGSLVGYLLGITELDPLEHQLLFERFLNPERVSMPDFDIDFCFERRGEVIEYVKEKYGRDHVAQIITFGTMAAKGAVRDVGRVLGFPYGEVDKIAKLISHTAGSTLEEIVKNTPPLATLAREDERVGRLLAIAKAVEGFPRHASIHAAGVVITPKPLTDYVPLARASEGEATTQFPMEDLEAIGLLKMDFLGLRTLTVLSDTIALVKESTGKEYTLATVPQGDEATYRLLCSGLTQGIFQLESGGMRRLLVQLAPERLDDLISLVALYRPGPLGSGMVEDFIKARHGEKEVTYLHPLLTEILAPTYGIILYQEQVMQICHRLGGFTLGEADLVRRAMGKKQPELLAAMREKFVQGADARGIPRVTAEEIFHLMEFFAGYGFNKSHSAAYALIAYWTAFFKANYPQAFMAALLTSVMGNTDKVRDYIEECRRLGIPIYPPDVNHSKERFTVEGDGIRVGLLAVKNLGSAAIQAILQEQAKAPFTSLHDFCRRVDLRTVNKRAVESLVRVGAFASTGHTRRAMLAQLEEAFEMAHRYAAQQASGQLSLFEPGADLAATSAPPHRVLEEEYPPAALLNMEKEYLGVYLSGHPLDPWREKLAQNRIPSLAEVLEAGVETDVIVGGVVSGWRRLSTKAGKTMATFTLEDLSGAIEVLVFPQLYEKNAQEAANDRVVLVKGRIEGDEEERKFLAQQIRWLPERPEG
ncbi:DNA polymerase III subunit alpha [Capillibacterium thermochitinicola]|uniref:DNA polymerase III subunit alpha n=1 Tax=Capillibacterium thermochitinicola TaxID=2699427 RepID=A0A8J6I0K3_9FIRM|nr:DNA polymerase III subunit alpha [Capillibacterium thermochitinicola]MBA2133525.1 DNA polymerase III subunit alpha [Capillibacterium thermochitinicola]